MEEWRDIEGYEGLYQVSDQGRVRSLNYNKTGKIKLLKPSKFSNGYLRIDLYKNGKRKVCLLHRLVAEAFILNPNNLPECNHIDEDITNCVASNLSWMSSKENANWGTRNERVIKTKNLRGVKGAEKPVKQLTLEGKLITIWPSIKKAAIFNNCYHTNIWACCNNKLNTYKGYKWAYA